MHIAGRKTVIVQQVDRNLADAAVGTMPLQGQGYHETAKPFLGYRQRKEDLVVVGFGRKGILQGLVGLVRLLVEKLATDSAALRQVADRLGPGQNLNRQVLPLPRPKTMGSAKTRKTGSPLFCVGRFGGPVPQTPWDFALWDLTAGR